MLSIGGNTIASLLEKYGKFNENLIRVYTKQIVEGLEYLHIRNTVHRGKLHLSLIHIILLLQILKVRIFLWTIMEYVSLLILEQPKKFHHYLIIEWPIHFEELYIGWHQR